MVLLAGAAAVVLLVSAADVVLLVVPVLAAAVVYKLALVNDGWPVVLLTASSWQFPTTHVLSTCAKVHFQKRLNHDSLMSCDLNNMWQGLAIYCSMLKSSRPLWSARGSAACPELEADEPVLPSLGRKQTALLADCRLGRRRELPGSPAACPANVLPVAQELPVEDMRLGSACPGVLTCQR